MILVKNNISMATINNYGIQTTNLLNYLS
jgi:hypothetical protein